VIAVSDFVAKVLREGVDEPHSPVEERRSRPPMRGDHSKIRVIHNGIDTDRFRPTEDRSQREQWGVLPNQLVFAVIGGYDLPRGKGQREFLRAAAAVQSRLPQGRFLIIGRGNLKETLEKDILDLGLTGKAWLTPYCFDMPGAMNATDCLVHPQVGTEALGGVVLEAFACGKPVIASNLDGIPEGFALGGYGALVPAEDVDALARAMLEQAQRPALGMAEREALHRRLAAQCSVAENARKVLRLYQEIHAAR
jgi:glycosyltransferase involved in cell wall biosynthesis